ncbi:MAG: 5-(carboxyamino)imidazole ribonucleotide synthase [Dehalococcoidia bacterium]
MTGSHDTPIVGIVGAGQLARMMAQAAIPLGLRLRLRLLAARSDDSAAQVWPDVEVGSPDSWDALSRFAANCDLLTFDHELIDPDHLAALEAAGRRLRPSASTQRFAQDKGYQREQFAAMGLPVPANRLVHSIDDVLAFAEEHGWPAVAKARRGGYDGRGVWVLQDPDAARLLVEQCAAAGTPLLVERWLPIERELAVLVARRPGGASVVYPVVETVQVNGICHEVLAPAPVEQSIAAEAARLALRIAELTDATGILAVEMFLAEGTLSINEIAVRPHNSGHYSIEGAVTSQFENHLRAVLDLPLGDTATTAPAVVMANVLGGATGTDPRNNLAAALSIPGIHVHLYGKEARPGRKVGHVTALGDDLDDVRQRARHAAALLVGGE